MITLNKGGKNHNQRVKRITSYKYCRELKISHDHNQARLIEQKDETV